jgi:hypothetical protein
VQFDEHRRVFLQMALAAAQHPSFHPSIRQTKTMTNWVSLRLTLSGPAAEIDRFRQTCIRPASDQGPDQHTFDLNAFVPMPSMISATLDDNSATAHNAALAATGSEDWYSWRLAHWGVKWNCPDFRLIMSAPDLVDFCFELPWSAPEPAFEALAAQYPQLSGRVCAVEEGTEWGLVGVFHQGTYGSTTTGISEELLFLVYNWHAIPIRRLTARALTGGIDNAAILPFGSQTGATKDAVGRIWKTLEAIAPARAAALSFWFDVGRYHAWIEAVEDGDGNEEASRFDQIKPATRTFLSTMGRSFTVLDRALMECLATDLCLTACQDEDEGDVEHVVRSFVSIMVADGHEDEFWDWAGHAALRPSVALDMIDGESLQDSFVGYAMVLHQQIQHHLQDIQLSQTPSSAEAVSMDCRMTALDVGSRDSLLQTLPAPGSLHL